MVPSEKSYCHDLNGSILMHASVLSKCCHSAFQNANAVQLFMNGRSIEESIKHLLELQKWYGNMTKKGYIPAFCNNCPKLEKYTVQDVDCIKYINFGDHSICNADCVYCEYGCSNKSKKQVTSAEERLSQFINGIQYMHEQGILDKNVHIDLGGGEITVYPAKERLYDIVKKYPDATIRIYTNGFIYDEGISEILSLNKNVSIMCDLDAGTRETYLKVKGFNKFDTVVSNLKKYAGYGKVLLKYIILIGMNDLEQDYMGTIDLLNQLNLKSIIISPEFESLEQNNRMLKREIVFSTAKFLNLLEDNNIEGIITEAWPKDYVILLNRYKKEFNDLNNH